MKTLTTLALLASVCIAPSISSADCGPCNTCPPVAVQKCYEPVCQVCRCCPKILGFLDCGGNRYY